MRVSHSRRSLPILLAGAALAATLSGCSTSPVQGIVDQASGGTIDVGGTSIPADFPSEVPLPKGEVVGAARVGTGTGKVWNVTLAVTGAGNADDIATMFTNAGFDTTSDIPGLGTTGGNAGYSNGAYGAIVVVTDESDGGYTANVSVTAIPE